MKKTKILLPLAMLALLFGTAACNNNNQGQGGGNNSSASTPAQAEKITITAAEGKTKLILGETVQLTASVQGVLWSSSDENIATVDAKGLVTSKAVGKTTIKATKDGYKDGSININVDLQNITVAAIDNKTELIIGDKVQLTASEQGVTWESSDPEVASVSATGEVTALKAGQADIIAKKDGFNNGKIAITVSRPAANLKVDMTSGAAHYSADGWWELPSAGGFGFAMQQVDGPTPIAQNQSWGQTDEPSDTFVGGFGVGDKETVTFTSSAAEKAEILLNIGNTDAAVLAEMMTIKLNGTAIDLTGIELEAHTSDMGGFAMSSLEFQDVSLGEVTLATPTNTLEFEMLVDNSLFLNEISFYAGSATMAVSNPPEVTQIAFTSTEVEVIEEETLQLAVDQTDVTWVSLDETVATVDQTGKVTGVKMGKTNIRAKKEGFYSAQVEITVNPKPVEGQIIVEAEDGEEVSDSYGGSSYMRQSDNSQWGSSGVHSGGAYVTYFSMGGGDVDLTLTIKFQATEAKTMVLSVVGSAPVNYMGGDAAAYVFGESATITLNENPVTITEGAEFPAPEGYTADMVEIVLGDVSVQAGENTLVFHTTGAAPSIDCFKLSVKA